jgi:endonuclease YncB( thermonuclease family)
MNWNTQAASIALLLFWPPFVVAQNVEPKSSRPDPRCGNPAVHSDFFISLTAFEGAEVIEVVSGNTVIVTLANGERRQMKLSGVDAPDIKTEAGQLSQKYLSELVLNRRVEVLLNGGDFGGKEVGIRLSHEGVSSDVNLSMLESGMGRYGLVENLGSYDKCVYRLAAEKAQKEKRGLWKEHF